MFTIEAATLNDLPLIVPLFDAYRVFYEAPSDIPGAERFLSGRMAKSESKLFFAFRDGHSGRQVAGFTQLYPSFSSVSMKRIWILNDLSVDPVYRKMGVASALMAKAADFAREDGAKGLSLATQHHNVTAQALYEKMGYGKDTEFHQYHLIF
jgi:ribosomal protein S18 acetylase RimI-like enzyme